MTNECRDRNGNRNVDQVTAECSRKQPFLSTPIQRVQCFINDLINPCLILHGYSVHMCVQVAQQDQSFSLFIAARYPLRETVLVLGSVSLKSNATPFAIPFSPLQGLVQFQCTGPITTNTRNPMIRHSNGVLVVISNTGMGISLATAFKRYRNENTSFNVLSSTEIKFLHSLGPFTRKLQNR